MSETINLGKEKFAKFLSVFNVIRQSCMDLVIKEGKICQLSDRRSAIYQMDITPLIGEATLLLGSIAIKADLLDPFKKQESSMELIVDERSYNFKDDKSEIIFQIPSERFLTNTFIPQEQLDQKLHVDDSGCIFRTTLDKYLIDRLAALSKGLSATTIKMKFEEGKAIFIMISGDKNEVTEAKLIKVDLEQEITGVCVFPVQPLLLGENIELECYRKEDQENLLLKITFKIEDIPMSVWSLAKLIPVAAVEE